MSVTDRTWMKAIRNIFATQQGATALTKLPSIELTDVQLFQIVQALLAEQAPENVPAQRRRLSENAHTLAEIETLMRMFQRDDTTPMVEPSSSPRYHFNFIKQPAPTPLSRPAGELWRRSRHWVQDQMGVLWVDFAAQMLGSSSMQPVLVTRSSPKKEETTGAEIIHQLSIGSEELDDLDLEIKAVRTADPDFCTLMVTARIPSRWPELGDVEVVVLSDESRRTGRTDEEGQVVFAQFPVKELERIGFQINPAP